MPFRASNRNVEMLALVPKVWLPECVMRTCVYIYIYIYYSYLQWLIYQPGLLGKGSFTRIFRARTLRKRVLAHEPEGETWPILQFSYMC